MGSYYRIVAMHSGRCLDVHSTSRDNGAPVIQSDCHGGANQQWRLETVVSYHKSIASHSGKCLDVHSASGSSGARIIQWDCHGGANQLWSITPPQEEQVPVAIAVVRVHAIGTYTPTASKVRRTKAWFGP